MDFYSNYCRINCIDTKIGIMKSNKIYAALKYSQQRTHLIAYVLVAVAFFITANQIRQQGIEGRTTIVNSGRAVAVDGCNRDFRRALALRAVLKGSEGQQKILYKTKAISLTRYRRAITFLEKQIEKIQLPDCRKARAIITDDPGRTTRIPIPLFPGGPGTR